MGSLLQQWRQNMRLQMFEVMTLTEEPRDVGRQRGQHFLAFPLAPRSRHQLTILSEIREAEKQGD